MNDGQSSGAHPDRRAHWETATSIPLVALSLVFIALYSAQVLDTTLPVHAQVAITAVLALIWVTFATDYLVRLGLATDKREYVKTSWVDLVSVLIPVFRPFLLLARLGDIPFFKRGSGGSIRLRLVIHAALFVLLFVYSISLAVLAVERPAPGANILTFGDSIWWACVTIATVGYGDLYPVTDAGRLLSVVLMAGGIAIVGVATATIVSYLNESITRQHRRRTDP
ncbi:potassium channel family protein [Herbiconiux moechotypicola]|uniref:Potassium channel family protein n=1 Tax=Herbiconiux moechotypicola TaxID=637393 RepID=A0ABN3E469_9MICO|nr:potassium channel family protein [Herbiconiux moechotypicola]MCS5731549.1 potassium channel family protein [Herbiconiux moechotypicola]